MGLKEPNICILSKVTAMSALCSAENPFQVKIASRRAAPVFSGEDRSMEQIVGRRKFEANGVAPCLAQESGPQSHRNDPGRPSRRSTWHTIELCRSFAHRDLETLFLCNWDPRDAKCRRRPGFGPTILPRCSGSSDQRGTRGARLGSIASSRIATLKSKDQLPPIHETRSAEGVRDLGPQYCRDVQGRPIREGHVVRD
jgi:hypothetical protein